MSFLSYIFLGGGCLEIKLFENFKSHFRAHVIPFVNNLEVKVFFSSSFLTFFNIDQNVDFFLKINYTVQKMELRRDLGCKDRKYTVGGKNLVILLFVVIMTFCYFMTKMYCTCNTMSLIYKQ